MTASDDTSEIIDLSERRATLEASRAVADEAAQEARRRFLLATPGGLAASSRAFRARLRDFIWRATH